MAEMSSNQAFEETTHPKGMWGRLRDRVFGMDDYEEADTESPFVDSRRKHSLRMESVKHVRIAVRLNASVFNDARIAADGLKLGQQQIVNLEKAPPQMAERIVDFLSGVTYALDGSVDKVGEKIYLFAPANVQVELDGGSEPNSPV